MKAPGTIIRYNGCNFQAGKGRRVFQPILLIEDDAKIARVVKVYLEGAGFRLVHAATGRDGMERAAKEPPQAVILDLMLPDITGEEVCQELREMGDFPIIMLTSKSTEEERVAGFALGADDYVVKPFSPRELVYRVKAVLKRAQRGDLSAAEPMSFEKGGLVIDGHSYTVRKGDRLIDLTPTEFKVLFTLASYPAKVFTREELVEKALGYQFEGYERSIDAHIKNIRRKLEDDPRNPLLIITIYGVGYRFSGKRDV
jgi:DNA-binding response OmpR family regulator